MLNNIQSQVLKYFKYAVDAIYVNLKYRIIKKQCNKVTRKPTMAWHVIIIKKTFEDLFN
jgi:hypothetical protein